MKAKATRKNIPPSCIVHTLRRGNYVVWVVIFCKLPKPCKVVANAYKTSLYHIAQQSRTEGG